MKKTLYIAAAVIAVMFAASCQKDDVQAAKKGMTLSANVEETKAIIDRDDTGEKVVWHFNWEIGDVVKVTAPISGKRYDFIYDGTSFKCETAEPEPGIWKAVYPASAASDDFKITMNSNESGKLGQDGTLESVMKNYLMDGASENYEQAETTISIKMTPKIAIVKITNNTGSEVDIDFTTKTSSGALDPTFYFKYITNVGTAVYNNSHGDFTGNIPDGETYWYIAPAKNFSGYGVCLKYGNTFYKNAKKDLEAGTVYNVTLK